MKEKIKDLYFKGILFKDISKILNIELEILSFHISEMGLPLRRGKFMTLPHNEIITKYSNNITIKELSEIYSVKRETIKNVLKFNNIKLKGHNRKYDFNQHYFDKIDSPDKAYFLGLIITDGYNTGYGLEIGLQKEDKYILEKFKNIINYKGELNLVERNKKNPKLSDLYRLRLSSLHLSNSLSNLGVIRKKSHHTYFPDIPEEFHSHFIRGCLDGDGSIFSNKKGSNLLKVAFIGNDLLVKSIQKILIEKCDLRETKLYYPKKGYKTDRICIFSFGGNFSVQKIGNYIYKDCGDLYLTRKKKYFDSISKDYSQKFCDICKDKQKCKNLCRKHYQEYQNSEFYKLRDIENYKKLKLQ